MFFTKQLDIQPAGEDADGNADGEGDEEVPGLNETEEAEEDDADGILDSL